MHAFAAAAAAVDGVPIRCVDVESMVAGGATNNNNYRPKDHFEYIYSTLYDRSIPYVWPAKIKKQQILKFEIQYTIENTQRENEQHPTTTNNK